MNQSAEGLIDHPLAHGAAPAWASEWGEDDRFGPYAVLEYPLQNGRDVVRVVWRWIPPGQFEMGSPNTEPGRWDDEGPQHQVSLKHGYWMMETPCTQAFWKAVMNGNNPSRFQDDRRPVERISWNDVEGFLQRLNGAVDGLCASLPTEAQWEYACRAGSQTALYPTEGAGGDIKIIGERNAPALHAIAWYGGNSGVEFDLPNGSDSSDWAEKQFDHQRAGTHPVGLKLPNAWGLYDMLGNVLEWCADGMREYKSAPETDPVGPSVESRAIRGGSWSNGAGNVRCAYRNQLPPEIQRHDLGFRLVRVQEGS